MKRNYIEVKIAVPRVKLVKLTSKMITKNYLEWINNKKITEFTEQRHTEKTKKNIIDFVNKKNKSKYEFLYAIFVKSKNEEIHVGNIKIGPIDFLHKHAEIGYLVGHNSSLNKGIATSAIGEICKIAKKKFKLKTIFANVYSMNIPSIRVLIKNNFILEGVRKKHFILKKKRVDCLIYGKIL